MGIGGELMLEDGRHDRRLPTDIAAAQQNLRIPDSHLWRSR
mgnify:CR=1 FL=1